MLVFERNEAGWRNGDGGGRRQEERPLCSLTHLVDLAEPTWRTLWKCVPSSIVPGSAEGRQHYPPTSGMPKSTVYQSPGQSLENAVSSRLNATLSVTPASKQGFVEDPRFQGSMKGRGLQTQLAALQSISNSPNPSPHKTQNVLHTPCILSSQVWSVWPLGKVFQGRGQDAENTSMCSEKSQPFNILSEMGI